MAASSRPFTCAWTLPFPRAGRVRSAGTSANARSTSAVSSARATDKPEVSQSVASSSSEAAPLPSFAWEMRRPVARRVGSKCALASSSSSAATDACATSVCSRMRTAICTATSVVEASTPTCTSRLACPLAVVSLRGVAEATRDAAWVRVESRSASPCTLVRSVAPEACSRTRFSRRSSTSTRATGSGNPSHAISRCEDGVEEGGFGRSCGKAGSSEPRPSLSSTSVSSTPLATTCSIRERHSLPRDHSSSSRRIRTSSGANLCKGAGCATVTFSKCAPDQSVTRATSYPTSTPAVRSTSACSGRRKKGRSRL